MTAQLAQAAPEWSGSVTPAQIKAARGLLGWGIRKLAARSRTTYHQVNTYECSGRVAVNYFRTSQTNPVPAICAALEAAGVEFTSGDEPGVKLREQAE